MTAALSVPQSNALALENQPRPSAFCEAEALSALADGQLEPGALAQLLGGDKTSRLRAGLPAAGAAPLQQEDAMLERWSTYHLIGAALRAPGQAAVPADAQFLARFQQALARETAQPLALMHTAALALPKPVEAANDPVFRWKMLAGFASFTAVCAVAWQLVGQPGAMMGPQPGLLAQQPQQPSSLLVATPASAVLRDSRMQELLAAHRQLGGDSAVQMPGPFLRNAAFAVDAPGR